MVQSGHIALRHSLPAFVRVGRTDIVRFTVDDVEALLRAGVVPEDGTTELLNGLIVRKDRAKTGGDPNMIGFEHIHCVVSLANLNTRLNNANRFVASQQPLQSAPDHLPAPDFALIRGTINDYSKRYPQGEDTHCVIEVADSSYERDTGEKLIAYAKAGVPQYVVINLRNRTAEVYETPDTAAGTYPPPKIVDATGMLSLRTGDVGERFEIPLADLLP